MTSTAIVTQERKYNMHVEGACHCGKIAFTASVDPSSMTLCHCTDCQVLSGCAYRASVATTHKGFNLLRGQPKAYVKTSEDGTKRVQAFCPDCGSSLYASDVGDDVTVYNLRVGNLKQKALLQPAKQIWLRSALPWSSNLESVPNLEKD